MLNEASSLDANLARGISAASELSAVSAKSTSESGGANVEGSNVQSTPAEGASSPAVDGADDGVSRKRRRQNVDYAALDAEMRKKEQQKAK
jgi:hypothetical protein